MLSAQTAQVSPQKPVDIFWVANEIGSPVFGSAGCFPSRCLPEATVFPGRPEPWLLVLTRGVACGLPDEVEIAKCDVSPFLKVLARCVLGCRRNGCSAADERRLR
jgi:hypothetical protein